MQPGCKEDEWKALPASLNTKRNRKLLSACLKCKTDNYKKVSLDIKPLRGMSFKSSLSWGIHTNVVSANDSQMAEAARGCEADKN